MITTLSLSFSVASVRQALPSVGVLSACAFKMIADVACSICQSSVIDDTVFEGLACGCVFHEQCLANYVEQARLSIESMRCPNCRKASHDVHELEQDLLRQHADSPANVVNEETVEVPIAVPAYVVNEETVDVPVTRRSRRSSRRSNIQTQDAPTVEAEPVAPTEEGQTEAAPPAPQPGPQDRYCEPRLLSAHASTKSLPKAVKTKALLVQPRPSRGHLKKLQSTKCSA